MMSPLRGFSWQPHWCVIEIAPSGRHRNSPIGAISCQPHSGDIIIITPLGFARGAIVAVTPRLRSGYTPRLRSGCITGNQPSAPLGVQSWQLPLGFARDAIVIIYRKIMSVMREKPIWLLIFEMNSCFRRVNSCRQGAL